MRFWHHSILQEVPSKKLSALNMTLCKIRSNPWGKPTPRTWYYNLPWEAISWYHSKVLKELQGRGWKINIRWLDYSYRGKLGTMPGTYDYEKDWGEDIDRISFDDPKRQVEDLKSAS